MKFHILHIFLLLFISSCFESKSRKEEDFIVWLEGRINLDMTSFLESKKINWNSNHSKRDVIIYAPYNDSLFYSNVGSYYFLDSMIEAQLRMKKLFFVVPHENFVIGNKSKLYKIYGDIIRQMKLIRNEKAIEKFEMEYDQLKYPDKRKVEMGGVPFILFVEHITESKGEQLVTDFYRDDILRMKGLNMED